MLDHISLCVRDIAPATRFYDSVLASLGYVRQWTGDLAVEYGAPGGGGKFLLIQKGADAHPPGAGWHLALTAPHAKAVDLFHAMAIELGARDEGAPGLRPRYGPGYYAAFIRDLDGYKIEAVFHDPDAVA
jgi:catechol 2,3-dioxygenase-like lactoylglutathione lyase family enzyme